MIVKIFTNPLSYTLDTLYQKDSEEVLIGVEDGAYLAVKKGLKLDVVIGDFDSLDQTKITFVKQNAAKTIEYPKKKDYTDTYLAVKAALEYTPDEIQIYGGIGARFDHTYANILLLNLGPIVMLDDSHKVYTLDPGEYTIENRFEYVSLFALEDVKGLSLKGFAYNLDKYDLAMDDPLCISNQGSGTLTFDEGVLLVIESSDK